MKGDRFWLNISFNKNENKYLNKITTIIVLFSLAIVMLVSAGLFVGTNDVVKKEIYNVNMGILSQLEMYVDMYIVDNIKETIHDNFIDIENNENLHEFFKNDNCSMKAYYRLIDFVSNIENKNTFMDSIYIYSMKNDAAISSNDGLVKRAVFDSYNNIVNIYKQIKAGKERQFWISPAQNENDIITYVQLVPATGYDDCDGFVAINIDSDKVVKAINNKFAKSGNVAVISEDGFLLSHSDKEILKKGYLDVDKEIFKQETGAFLGEINGEKQDVVWLKSPRSNMLYAFLFPEQAYGARIKILQIYSLFIMLGMLVIVFISSKYISGWLTKPMRKNATFLEGKFVHDIAHGNLSDESDIASRCLMLDAKFEQSKFYFMTFEASNLSFDDIYITDKKNISKISKEIVRDTLKNAGSVLCAAETLSQVAVIFNTELTKEEVISLSRKLIEELKGKCRVSFNAVVSDAVDCISKIGDMNGLVYKLLEYRYIFGYDNVFTLTDLEKWERNFDVLSVKEQGDMEKWLRMGQINEFSDAVDEVLSAIRKGQYSISTTRGILFQIQSIIFRIGKEKKVFDDNEKFVELLAYSDKIKTVDEYDIWISTMMEWFKQGAGNRISERQSLFIEQTEEYIIANIGKTISLNSVADAMNISPTYLSKIFKDETGMNFSAFLADKKLEKATELLLNTKMSMPEIAEQIGYSNETYFTKLFKAKYGTTPGQYRKLNK